MKKYHVFGLGNALVDTEIQVSEGDLNELGIKKGMMTLVDQKRQTQLINHLGHHLILSKRACGGSAANSIIALTQFGGRGYLACKVANDENGQFYQQDLIDNGVDHSSSKLGEGTTGTCLVMVTPDAERTMNSYLGISEEFCCDDIDGDAIENSQFIYLEGYLVTKEAGRQAAIKAKQIAQTCGTQVAINLSDPGIVKHFESGLKEIIGSGVDLLFCNKQEALTWCNTDNLDQATKVMGETAKQFVITLGNEGAIVGDGSTVSKVQAKPVSAIDTNGAGDMFAGAYLYGITQGYSRLDAAAFANQAASVVVSQYGPRLDSRQYSELSPG
jgi:sugar/nucleoside kinase (ribokinase family)